MSTNGSSPRVGLLFGAVESAGRRGGGIHNAVLAQALGLRANGVDVKIFTASEDCAAASAERGIACHQHRMWHSGIDPMVRVESWRQARAFRPQAVVHNSGRSWMMGPILFPGALHAQVMHRELVRPYRFFRKWIALSEPYAATLRASPDGRHRQIAVAPNGLLEDPQPVQRRLRDGPLVVGTAGRLSEAKGIHTLIEAVAAIVRQGGAIDLRLAGPGSEQFEALSNELGVADHVTFLGWTDDIDGFLDDLDVFCLPSRKEAFGLVLIEAMARGLPVISTDTHGARGIVRSGKTGWLVPIDDVDALASAMRLADADRQALIDMGGAAYDDVCARFTPQATGRALLDALRLLGARL